MDSIKTIKRKFIWIIISLLLLFIINLFYLSKLYKNIREETEKMAVLCIEEADNEEVHNRMVYLSKTGDEKKLLIFPSRKTLIIPILLILKAVKLLIMSYLQIYSMKRKKSCTKLLIQLCR